MFSRNIVVHSLLFSPVEDAIAGSRKLFAFKDWLRLIITLTYKSCIGHRRIPMGCNTHLVSEDVFLSCSSLAQPQIQVVMHSIPQQNTAQLQSAGRALQTSRFPFSIWLFLHSKRRVLSGVYKAQLIFQKRLKSDHCFNLHFHLSLCHYMGKMEHSGGLTRTCMYTKTSTGNLLSKWAGCPECK